MQKRLTVTAPKDDYFPVTTHHTVAFYSHHSTAICKAFFSTKHHAFHSLYSHFIILNVAELKCAKLT